MENNTAVIREKLICALNAFIPGKSMKNKTERGRFLTKPWEGVVYSFAARKEM